MRRGAPLRPSCRAASARDGTARWKSGYWISIKTSLYQSLASLVIDCMEVSTDCECPLLVLCLLTVWEFTQHGTKSINQQPSMTRVYDANQNMCVSIHEDLTLCLATSRAYMLQMDPPGAKTLSPPANPIISLILARTCSERTLFLPSAISCRAMQRGM